MSAPARITRRLRPWAVLRVVVAVVVLAVAVAVGGAGTAGASTVVVQQAGATSGGGNISVTHVPSGASGICLPPLFALRSSTSVGATSFTLRITVAAPLCAPLDVTAAIYTMPGNGVAWPQRLRETLAFVLSEPGVTEVTFVNDCSPVQYDVLTGPTPQEIAPWGEWHGPMLFPFDTSTALQSFGCGPAPVVPESPSVLLLPLSAAAVVGAGAVVVARRRRSVG